MSEETQQAERLARIEAQIVGISDDLAEVRSYLAGVLAELKQSDREYRKALEEQIRFCSGRTPLVDHVVKRVDDLESRMKDVEKLMPAVRVIMWVGAALGASIIALIWALITGQATIAFH